MPQVKGMDSPNHYNELIVELTIATIKRLKEILGPITQDRFKRSDCCWHVYDSDFEIGCQVLWQLGLAYGIRVEINRDNFLTYEENTELIKNSTKTLFMPPIFRFFEENEIRQSFNFEAVSNPPCLNSIIESYLRVSTDYPPVENNLPITREPFNLPSMHHLKAIHALIKYDYVSEKGESFLWTGKIGGAMLQALRWDHTHIDDSLIDQDNALKQSLAISERLSDPSSYKPPENQLNMGIAFFASLIMNQWNGKEWQKEPLQEPIIMFDDAIHIAQFLQD